MIIVFIVLIIVASAILGLIVLVQNPKGGGLTGSVAGLSNQFMGVKQTTDILEKGTWLFAAIIGLLCLFSSFFISGGSSAGSSVDAAPPSKSAPVNPNPVTPAQPSNPAPGK